MFASGNFCNFPIDDDVSIGAASDLMHSSISSIYSSDGDSSSRSSQSRGTSTDSLPICVHAHSYECLEEVPEDQPIDAVHMKNTRDLCDSLHVILTMPDLCDVTFLVGPALKPIYGLKAVMSTRSRVLHSLFLKHHVFHNPADVISPKKKPVGCFPKFFNHKKRDNKNAKPHIVISLPDHDPVCFGAFVTYLHTGSVNINVRNLAGLLHLTEVYKVDELPKACWDFADRCLTSQTAISLLTSAQKYVASQSVSRLIETILQFIDQNASRVVANKEFLLSQPPIASTILTRPQLLLSENRRVAAILSWSKHHHRSDATDLLVTLSNLLDSIDFSRVTNEKLRNDVMDLGYVPPMSFGGQESSSSSNHLGNARLELFSMKKHLRKQSTAIPAKCRRSSKRLSSESGFDSMY